ncbi:tetratricopeptide repeat protein [Nonomuraea sediminis]|uniref:tetratricopeptide repeat protein n=1 Tax=Nonomuraea sediminis TaxID=2835864 RepID=UPI001BDC6198|nr:tetratricopeptide repeat protein [Nonomuraea sediminis]
MAWKIWVWTNRGIVSSGPDAINIVNNTVQAPPPVPAASVESPPGVVRLRSTPAATRLFVGRGKEFAALAKTLRRRSGGNAQVLTGLGGIGKSTLAAQYALTQRGKRNPIWWIDAEDPAQIDLGLEALARQLYPGNSPERPVEWAKEWLAGHKDWLVILDNVTQPSVVAELIGSLPSGRFLVTSRQTVGWEGVAPPIQLGVLPIHEAVQMVARRVADRDLLDGAEEVCLALGGLPLAIEMAGHYMSQNRVPARTYLRRLSDYDGAVLEWTHAGGELDRTVRWTWQVTLDRIAAQHGPLPMRLLGILAWVAPDDIPISLLPGEAEIAVGHLAAYGLVTRSENTLSVHRLVQAVSRNPESRRAAGQALRTAWKDGPEPSSRLAPHLAAYIAAGGLAELDDASAWLADAFGFHLERTVSAQEAIAFFEKAMAEHVGSDHPALLSMRTSRAILRTPLDPLDVTIGEFERIVADKQRVLGPGDLDTLETRLELGSLFERRKQYRQAFAHYRQLITDAERALGRHHSLTLQAKWNLAEAYVNAEDLKWHVGHTFLVLLLWWDVLTGLAESRGLHDETTRDFGVRIRRYVTMLAHDDDPKTRWIVRMFNAGAHFPSRVRKVLKG